MLYQRIGKRIRAQRMLQQMTQEQLALKAGISLSFLGHIERGTRKLSVETLYALCMALDCSSDQLMETGKYSRNPDCNVRELLREALVMLDD